MGASKQKWVRCLLYIVYRLSRGPVEGVSGLLKGSWWGYGLRLKIVVRNAQLGVQAKWLGITAAAQLGYLDAEFEVGSIGIYDPVLFGLLPALTGLNIMIYREILVVGDKIQLCVRGNWPKDVRKTSFR